MSVLIRGMEMPISCWRCSLSQLYEKPREMLVCKITHEEVLRHKIDGKCPLVPVPPHGRLIDSDELCKKLKIMYAQAFRDGNSAYHSAYRSLEKIINDAPTVLERSDI